MWNDGCYLKSKAHFGALKLKAALAFWGFMR